MNHIFRYATKFDQDVSEWDVSNVTNMSYMFYEASSFNQDVSGTKVDGMFEKAELHVLQQTLR